MNLSVCDESKMQNVNEVGFEIGSELKSKSFIFKYKMFCVAFVLFLISSVNYLFYIKAMSVGESMGFTLLFLIVIGFFTFGSLMASLKEDTDEVLLASRMNIGFSHFFLIAASLFLYNTFTDGHMLDYRTLEKTKIAYMESYQQFKSNELSKINIDHRDFVKSRFYHDPIFRTHLNVNNFKEADKDVIVSLEFQKGLIYFIKLGDSFDSKFNRHLILQKSSLSPYIDDDFKTFGKLNPDGKHTLTII